MAKITLDELMRSNFNIYEARRIVDVIRQHQAKNVSLDVALDLVKVSCGGMGVCKVPGEDQNKPAIAYVNMGDRYTKTLFRIGDRWVISDWSSVFEKGEYN